MMLTGMPLSWALLTAALAAAMACRALIQPLPARAAPPAPASTTVPAISRGFNRIIHATWTLLGLKLMMVGLFLLVIVSGLYGTPAPQYNLATELTWNIWWTGLIVSVFFLASGWCAVCPWDAIASWLSRLNMLGRPNAAASLGVPVPSWLRGVWPALCLLLLLSWLELGYGITASPYATAVLAIVMLTLTTASHLVFERKAFCRHFCPVGRTIGFYAQLAPLALRRVDANTCNRCTTLDCYHGTESVEACPTGLLMKNLQENTYCTSCNACIRSCPQDNIAWQLRPLSQEACQDARPRTDEAWFVLLLLALAILHGLSMIPGWEQLITQTGRWLGESGMMLMAFTASLLATIGMTAALFAALLGCTFILLKRRIRFRRLWMDMSFMMLPLAFSYHLAHNLNHLIREHHIQAWLLHPLGGIASASTTMIGQAPVQQGSIMLSTLQAGFILAGFYLSMLILRHRAAKLLSGPQQVGTHNSRAFAPLMLFAWLISSLQLWLLMQPMMMRF